VKLKPAWQTRLPSSSQDDLAADGDENRLPKSAHSHPSTLHLDIHAHTYSPIAVLTRLPSCSHRRQWPVLDLAAPALTGCRSSRTNHHNRNSSDTDIDHDSSRSPSPMRIRRHRRSYTISAPLGTRVNAFPNPSSLPPTPPRKDCPAPNSDKENALPPRCTSSNSAPLLSGKARGKIPESPKRPRIFHTTSIFNDRFLDLPPLPEAWTIQHDRAICLLDSRNYSHPHIVDKMRRVYPELRGTLTPLMIDKRLRILDQNVELDYWRINHRAHSITPQVDEKGPVTREESTPTKASKKGSRIMDVVMGRKSEPRTAVRGLGMGFRSVFDWL